MAAFAPNWWLAGLVNALVLARPVTAAAEPIEFHWTAPAGCPSRESVARRLDELLEGVPPRNLLAWRADFDVEERAEGGYRVRVLTVHGQPPNAEHGERWLEDEDCASLGGAAVLVVAMAIAPELTPAAAELAPLEPSGSQSSVGAETAQRQPTENAEATEVQPPRRPPKSEPRPAERLHPERSGDWHWRARVGLAARTAVLPQWASGPALALGLGRDHWTFEVRAEGWLPVERRLSSARSDESVPGGRFAGGAFGLSGCAELAAPRSPTLSRSPWALGTCAGFELVLIEGEGVDVIRPDTAVRGIASALVELTARVRLGAPGWHLRGIGGAGYHFAQPRYVIREAGVVHEPAMFSARAQLGLELDL